MKLNEEVTKLFSHKISVHLFYITLRASGVRDADIRTLVPLVKCEVTAWYHHEAAGQGVGQDEPLRVLNGR